MTSKHLIHLHEIPATEQTEGGKRIKASKANFPILKGMSLYKLILYKNGAREPHWHPNADELGYCLKGSALVSIYGNFDHKETFVVNAGETFFVPSGFLHHIENAGNTDCEIIVQFSHEEPEEFGISYTLSSFSNSVLGNTWAVKEDVFKNFKRSKMPTFAGLRKSPLTIPEESYYTSPHKYNLDGSQPILTNDGGSAKMARQSFWPILKKQALYALSLSGVGMREPHWHPETAELGYVREGKGRMSILDPDGTVDTYEIHEGDLYFIPKAYPHHIENLEKTPLNIMIFFDQGMPGDIGLTGSIRSFSNEVLGAATNIDPPFFDQLTKYYKDLFIVNKINPT